jgi:hypothetical protein
MNPANGPEPISNTSLLMSDQERITRKTGMIVRPASQPRLKRSRHEGPGLSGLAHAIGKDFHPLMFSRFGRRRSFCQGVKKEKPA